MPNRFSAFDVFTCRNNGPNMDFMCACMRGCHTVLKCICARPMQDTIRNGTFNSIQSIIINKIKALQAINHTKTHTHTVLAGKNFPKNFCTFKFIRLFSRIQLTAFSWPWENEKEREKPAAMQSVCFSFYFRLISNCSVFSLPRSRSLFLFVSLGIRLLFVQSTENIRDDDE